MKGRWSVEKKASREWEETVQTAKERNEEKCR